DIRLICATNKNLEKMVRDGLFREDLYYRINTIPLALPPLRDRNDEIVPLAELFLKKYAARYHRSVKSLSAEAVSLLCSHRWSGNIRELQNCIEKAVILSEGEQLQSADIQLAPSRLYEDVSKMTGEESLDDAEEQAIRAAMLRFGGNLSMVAKSLGISRPTLYAKLKKYHI
ncbi:MAG: sigma-54-dependent Fis family transcriptional regulator, partial [Bacteroidales bacterium]|nr:sigma-54-dependent Fis family transcriptional regulator [Bacteroidales bacterium]